jgi:hypothetical protein
MGFTNVTSVAKDMAPTPADVGNVYDIKPSGPAVVNFATPVVVTYYDGIPVLPAPGSPILKPSTPITAPGSVTVDWSNQNFSSFCPNKPTTGLSGFTVTYQNGITTTVGATVTSVPITVSSGPSFNVYLTVLCGTLKSPQSAPVIVTVN